MEPHTHTHTHTQFRQHGTSGYIYTYTHTPQWCIVAKSLQTRARTHTHCSPMPHSCLEFIKPGVIDKSMSVFDNVDTQQIRIFNFGLMQSHTSAEVLHSLGSLVDFVRFFLSTYLYRVSFYGGNKSCILSCGLSLLVQCQACLMSVLSVQITHENTTRVKLSISRNSRGSHFEVHLGVVEGSGIFFSFTVSRASVDQTRGPWAHTQSTFTSPKGNHFKRSRWKGGRLYGAHFKKLNKQRPLRSFNSH